MNRQIFLQIFVGIKVCALFATAWLCLAFSYDEPVSSYARGCWGVAVTTHCFQDFEHGFPLVHEEGRRYLDLKTGKERAEPETKFSPAMFGANGLFVVLVSAWLFLPGMIGKWVGVSRWFVAMFLLVLVVLWPTILTSRHIEQSSREFMLYQKHMDECYDLHVDEQAIPTVFRRLGLSKWVPERWSTCVFGVSIIQSDNGEPNLPDLAPIFERFPRIHLLDIDEPTLTDQYLEKHKTQLRNITYLIVGWSKVSDDIFEILKDCHKLQDLEAHGTQITTITVEDLANFPRLQFLDVSECELTDETEAMLLKHIPS